MLELIYWGTMRFPVGLVQQVANYSHTLILILSYKAGGLDRLRSLVQADVRDGLELVLHKPEK